MRPPNASTHALLHASGGADAGFLAVDALVGLLIAAMGVVIVMQAQSLSMRMLSAARDMRLASTRAELCLAQWHAGQPDGVVSSRVGALVVETQTARTPGVGGARAADLCTVRCIARVRPSNVSVALTTRRVCPLETPP